MAFLVLGAGVFLSICLFILARHFANRTLGIVGILVLLIGIGGGGLLTLYKTEEDKIRDVVRSLATAITTNDSSGVVGHVSTNAEACRIRAAEEMQRYEFDACRVSSFEPVEFDAQNPNRATVSFEVWVTGRIRREMTEFMTAPIELKLWFEKGADEKWQVTGYDYRRPSNDPWGDTPANGAVGNLYEY